MTRVYWLGQALADVPSDPSWLSRAERERADAFRVPKRRDDWRLGRWTAKRALVALLGSDAGAAGDAARCGLLERHARAEVRPAASGVPEPFWDGVRAPWSLSISHAGGRALVALAEKGAALGCDLEEVAARSSGFLEEAFTDEERQAIAAAPAPDLASALYWSAKESVLKALGEGLRLPLHDVVVAGRPAGTNGAGWQPIEVRRRSSGARFAGFWQRADGGVITVVSDPAPRAPAALCPEP
jgi:4'-phosphopantetheinyl transferase